jgi:hypothetical protein
MVHGVLDAYIYFFFFFEEEEDAYIYLAPLLFELIFKSDIQTHLILTIT